MPEALSQIEKGHRVRKSNLGQRSLEWHIGRSNNADGQANFTLRFVVDLVRLQQWHAAPGRFVCQLASATVDRHDKVESDTVEEIARQLTELAGAIESQRWTRGHGDEWTGRSCDFAQQRQSLTGAGRGR